MKIQVWIRVLHWSLFPVSHQQPRREPDKYVSVFHSSPFLGSLRHGPQSWALEPGVGELGCEEANQFPEKAVMSWGAFWSETQRFRTS